MSLAQTFSAHLIGLDAEIVTVEVDISNGLHSFSVIGLGDRSVDESKDRVSAAIKNSGYVSPKQKNQKVVVSLAPADIRKEGPVFDLAIAMAYLLASGEIDFDPKKLLFLGELSLEGNVSGIHGLLALLPYIKEQGFTEVFIPIDNAEEASLSRGITIYKVRTLREVIDHVTGVSKLTPLVSRVYSTPHKPLSMPTMDTIRGNEHAKQALEIAAAGAHNVLMFGPPGTGKTLLAQSFISLLPPLSYEHSLEVTSIHSAARTLGSGLIDWPPFRAPHHTASSISIIGGGTFPKPGEITLAHRGVLFLDEFPEFNRAVIEALRQPLEEKTITVTRMRGSVTFPAQTIIIASMNPCPCGRGRSKGCVCSEKSIANYWRKISGPIMDRIDIWIHVDTVDYAQIISEDYPVEESADLRAHRVIKARTRQKQRFEKHLLPFSFNSELGARDIEKIIVLDKTARNTLSVSAKKLELSGRAIHRTIKVAQTIADLSGHDEITNDDMLEALNYRKKS